MKCKLCYYLLLLVTVSTLNVQLVYAYNGESHGSFSIKAADKSMPETEYLPAIGIQSLIDMLVGYSEETRTIETKSIRDWFKQGAKDEDLTRSKEFARYRNHFYDPINNEGYSYAILSGEPASDWALEQKQLPQSLADTVSPKWALKSNEFPNQEFSFQDAVDYLYQAMTLPTPQEREEYLAKTFYALGHVLHLVQDMASMPHVRGDSHGGYIVFGAVSLYETYTEQVFKQREGQTQEQSQQDPSVYNKLPDKEVLLSLPYPKVVFPRAYDFWTTEDDKGLADFTNRNFVSQGTNFDTADYPNPVPKTNQKGEVVKTTYTIQQLYQHVGQSVPDVWVEEGGPDDLGGYIGKLGEYQGRPATVDFVSNTIEDNYSGDVVENPRASGFSIFNADLDNYLVCEDHALNEKEVCREGKYSLNRFTFDAAHQFLIPRAVAYSAGLLDYFFRGKLEINLPEDGVYAIVDHAVVNQIGDGFKRVKMKVKNMTPDIDGVPQNMMDGEIVLVARYHEDECYEPDLTGGHASETARWNGCKSKWERNRWNNSSGNFNTTNLPPSWKREEKVTTSFKKTLSLNAGEETHIIFNFANPIPLNAIDLTFQVVYKGQLGNDEATVVAYKDISEPTFFSAINMRDHTLIDGIIYPDEVVATTPSLFERLEEHGIDITATPYNNINLRFGDTYNPYISPIVTTTVLFPGTYLRVAFLSNKEKTNVFYRDERYVRYPSAYFRRIVKPQEEQFQGIWVNYPIERCSNGNTACFNYIGKFRNTHYKSLLLLYSYHEELSPGGSVSDYSKVVPFQPEDLAPKPVFINF